MVFYTFVTQDLLTQLSLGITGDDKATDILDFMIFMVKETNPINNQYHKLINLAHGRMCGTLSVGNMYHD